MWIEWDHRILIGPPRAGRTPVTAAAAAAPEGFLRLPLALALARVPRLSARSKEKSNLEFIGHGCQWLLARSLAPRPLRGWLARYLP